MIKVKGMRALVTVALVGLVTLGLSACQFGPKPQQGHLVSTQEAFREAVKSAVPGDTIVLANGVWEDFEIVFRGEGTADKPITLTAQTKGQVIISGRSNLRLGGKHLVVSGLIFKDGQSPTGEVIAYRADSRTLAYHSRVTETVIDNFNKSDRFEADTWVSLFGRHNRFDHNHLVNKKNRGVTLTVRLNTEESRENFHRIDHNYFGPRPLLGSNGAETLRVGTSHFSLTNSNTLIENNIFDRCDGEVEIISIKSGGNVIQNNLFLESKGAVVLRHGNDNRVERNVFLGNGVDHTGGVRVINEGQVIRDNYFEGLTGHRFGGALVVMNGVPDSPINRYHQVKNAVIENNTFVNSNNIQLAAGADEERSARIIESQMTGNLFHSDQGEDIFTVYDDVSGLTMSGNVGSGFFPSALTDGIRRQDVELVRGSNGLHRAVEDIQAGAPSDLVVMKEEQVGVSWYAKAPRESRFDTGREILVEPGLNTLFDAVEMSSAGDVVSLAPGRYIVDKIIRLPHAVTVRSQSGGVSIVFERGDLFHIEDGGSLKLEGVSISGETADDSAGNSLIRTSKYSMLNNYALVIRDSEIAGLDVNHSFNVLSAYKSTMADEITLERVTFQNITGHVLDLDKEYEDLGIYNAEYITITGSVFDNIGGTIANVYRGGTDESTFGPLVRMFDNRFLSVGQAARNKRGASVFLHGVQYARIENNRFYDSARIVVEHTVGEPRTWIIDNAFVGTKAPSVSDDTAVVERNVDQ